MIDIESLKLKGRIVRIKNKTFPFLIYFCNKSNIEKEFECTHLSFLPLSSPLISLLF